jgi:membrane protein DedA with SNARE-associated domain
MDDLLPFIARHGYPGLFLLLMLGILGVPVPDELVLAFAGFLIFKGLLHPLPTLIVAFAGTSCGITISYTLGRLLGFFLLEKYGYLVHLSLEHLQKVQAWSRRWGKWVLLVGYFIAGVRHAIAMVAGASRLPLPVFALFAYAGALLWTVSFLSVGYFLGEELPRVHQQIHHVTTILGGLLLALVAGYLLFRWLRRRRGTGTGV